MHGVTRRMPSCLFWFANSCNASAAKSTYLALFEGILDYDYKEPGKETRGVGSFAGRLAESWKQVDPRTWEFVLRKGVKWHDGEELTSKDVVWSLNQWGDTLSSGTLRKSASLFEKVEATGSYGVRITLHNASPYFLDAITYLEPRVLPAHLAERAGNPTGDALTKLYDAHPAGTGPFKLRSFQQNSGLEMERFDGYWKQRPHLDGIRVIFLKDVVTWQAAFAAGKIDYITLDDKVQVEQVTRSIPGATVLKYYISSTASVVFNTDRKPFNDVRARRAIHLALDRQALDQNVTFGEAYMGLPPMAPGLTAAGIGLQQPDYLQSPGFRQPKTQDIAEAKRLLAEAGIPPNAKFVLKHDRGSAVPSAYAEPVAGQLKSALGLDISVQPMEPATWLAQVEVGKDYEIAVSGGVGSGSAPALDWSSAWSSDGPDNYFGVKDPTVDRLLSTAGQEMDQVKRNEVYKQFQRRMLEQVYLAPLPNLPKFQLWQPWLHDFYGTLASNPAMFNSDAYWIDLNKAPAERKAW